MLTDPTDRRALRPHVSTEPTDQPAEAFQNETLRPILKMQHELLLGLFRHYLVKRKVNWSNLAREQRSAKAKELISRDNRLRGLLFGTVIGQFTTDELAFYLEQESECNRRLTGLLTDRLLDGLG
jgi:hypothetical protein